LAGTYERDFSLMISPNVCVLKTDGINCDVEMLHAFTAAGADPELVHVNQLRTGERRLDKYGVLAIPGGFSYGDDIASGKVLAVELTSYLSDQLQDFVDQGKPLLGVCNGFQVLVRTGLLPSKTIGEQQATLAENAVGRFDCRWINLAVGQSACKFVSPEDFEEQPIPMQTAHGEGRFFGSAANIQRLMDNSQVVFRYASLQPGESVDYPDNPNGAVDNIAGICDPSGLILGMMPHPERSVAAFHPHRIRTEAARRAANTIFTNITTYAREM
jgi:phosphoribosylformylglycinamidine synthase I